MRRMRGETQRIDRQHLRTAQFFGLGVLDGLEVRQVGQRPDAEARDLEAFGMVARHGLMNNPSVHGDEYATVQIEVPTNLTPDARRKLKEFEQECNGSHRSRGFGSGSAA